MRYFIHLAYKGTAYHGWQIQPNAHSLQACVQDALSKILSTQITVIGAGRTDAGVHAACFYAHFETEVPFVCRDLCYALNRITPKDIAFFSIFPVKYDMHARFSALSRTYTYTITRIKNPFLSDTALLYRQSLDIDAMNRAAACLYTHTDFTSFSKLHTDTKTNNCTIQHAAWVESDSLLVFTIQANRFLRNMVRAIVGTLLEVGKGNISVDDFSTIIENKSRCDAGASIAAHGLSLVAITYPYGFDSQK